MSKPFEWDGSFHDLCPNCEGQAPPHVECICRLLAEAEHRGMAQGQQALELWREAAKYMLQRLSPGDLAMFAHLSEKAKALLKDGE